MLYIINFHFLKKNNFIFSKINDFFLPYGTVTEFNENKYILCNLGDAQKIFVRNKKIIWLYFFLFYEIVLFKLIILKMCFLQNIYCKQCKLYDFVYYGFNLTLKMFTLKCYSLFIIA